MKDVPRVLQEEKERLLGIFVKDLVAVALVAPLHCPAGCWVSPLQAIGFSLSAGVGCLCD